jgi:hypothetical protein
VTDQKARHVCPEGKFWNLALLFSLMTSSKARMFKIISNHYTVKNKDFPGARPVPAAGWLDPKVP